MDAALKKRVVTAGILIGTALGVGVLGAFLPQGEFLYAVVVCLIVGVCGIEFGQVCGHSSQVGPVRVMFPVLTALPAVLVILSAGSGPESVTAVHQMFGVLLGSVIGGVGAIGWLVIRGAAALHRAERSTRDLGVGMFHIGFCGACVTALTLLPGSVWSLLWLILVVCINDSAAYFVGRAIGGPKLAPSLSPNKTVSGSIGGLVGGGAAGLLGNALILDGKSMTCLLVFTFAVVVTAQLGDLAKSYVKRLHEVKDSGSFLPGHGGFLDRMDGMLMAAPLVYAWMLWLQGI